MPLKELYAACEREGIVHRQTTPGERFEAGGPVSSGTPSSAPSSADTPDGARKDSSLFVYCDVGETVVVL